MGPARRVRNSLSRMATLKGEARSENHLQTASLLQTLAEVWRAWHRETSHLMQNSQTSQGLGEREKERHSHIE